MCLNLSSDEKSISAGSLLNNLYLWPLVCVIIENSKRSLCLRQQGQKQFYSTIQDRLIVYDVQGFANLNTVNATCTADYEAAVHFQLPQYPGW